MTGLMVIVIAIILFGLMTLQNRAYKNAGTRNKVINVSNKKQITLQELASKRHNIHTAQNLIALGLVKPARHPLEEVLQDAYSGVFHENDNYSSDIVEFYGLHPNGRRFVGH